MVVRVAHFLQTIVVNHLGILNFRSNVAHYVIIVVFSTSEAAGVVIALINFIIINMILIGKLLLFLLLLLLMLLLMLLLLLLNAVWNHKTVIITVVVRLLGLLVVSAINAILNYVNIVVYVLHCAVSCCICVERIVWVIVLQNIIFKGKRRCISLMIIIIILHILSWNLAFLSCIVYFQLLLNVL